jgi:hypothetical protein
MHVVTEYMEPVSRSSEKQILSDPGDLFLFDYFQLFMRCLCISL